MTDPKDLLLDAILPHVVFDGWGEASFRAAVAEAGINMAVARGVCPRGAVDLALALHARGDADMLHRLQQTDLGALRFRDRVASAVRFRLEAIPDKEVVRRAVTLFALPMHAASGTGAIWRTADLIWTALGDRAEDYNWYTKRLTLSGVYSATLLYWLGDDSPGHDRTWQFLDRRIEDVMRVEKAKARVHGAPLLKPLLAVPSRALGLIRPPAGRTRTDLPGHIGEGRP
ncbi:MAG: COQ9 family protein [Qingshengfaniella sp.]